MKITSARKGGPVSRLLPISTALHGNMVRWIEEDKRKFSDNLHDVTLVHYRGLPVTTIKTAWANAKARAGITRKIRPYDLCHAMVTDALRRGEDLKSVSEIIGRSRPDTTLREYQHVTKEQHRSVVENIRGLFEFVKGNGKGA